MPSRGQRHIPGMSSTMSQVPAFKLDPVITHLEQDFASPPLMRLTCQRPGCGKDMYIPTVDVAQRAGDTAPCWHCFRVGRIPALD